MAGIYIHIPFCKSRCIYCGFYSTTGRESQMDRYVDCLLEEQRLRSLYIEKECAETLYVGGGTPSLLSPVQLKRLKAGIPYNDFKEFTIECNPDDVTREYAMLLKSIGITRVSMGVQTFSDNRLHFLHRRHSSEDIKPAIEHLRSAGIENISIDLMFGFPGETISEWSTDIDMAVSLGAEHISAYSLMYEKGTPLYRMFEEGRITPVEEEVSRQMFEVLIDKLESSGYEHYEISNFAKTGFRSRHNSSYWHDVPYIGLGAGAHSYDGKSRQWNISDIDEYMKAIESGHIPCEREDIDDVTHYNDIVTTALRTSEGIELSSIQEPFKAYLMENAEKGIRNGNLCIRDNHIRITRKGLFISDDIMSDLIYI